MITYTIAMPAPHTHLYQVTLEIDAIQGATLDLALPVWTPGSYMVRDYARHIQQFSAASVAGAPLAWRKLDKSTWQIETGGASALRVSYAVYANELSVRTSHLDGSHGFVAPATVCMYVPARSAEPLLVRVAPPTGWRVSTGLEPHAGAAAYTFLAQDYDELVDSPLECGTQRVLEFSVDGIPHRIVLWGHGNEDEAQVLADTQRIVEMARDMFGGLPYQHYTFIVHLAAQRGGGLEHRNSVAMLVDRWTFQPRRAYERYLSLTAHEFFHVWNVKRIRAAALGPFDYQRENYTTLLWAMEGVTDYYTDLLLLRAGLIDTPRYLELIAENILALQGQPGRALLSLEQSSFNTWIKQYRPDENTPNTAISYYLKGGLVALLLDLEIRQRSAGARSLDDVLRYLFERYPISGPGIPEPDGYRSAVEAVLGDGSSFAEFFASYVAGTAELDYARALGYAGLRMDWGQQAGTVAPAWLGIRTRSDNGRLKVSAALSDGPAYAAGVYAEDELLALDGFRISEDLLKARLSERRPGDTVLLSLFRRDELLHVPVQLSAASPDSLRLLPQTDASDSQRQLFAGWLGEALDDLA